MTNASHRAIEAMQALAGQDLEQADDEQIRREFIEDGLDPDVEARRVAEKLDAVVAQFMRDRASAAKALRAATAHRGPRPRPTLARMAALIQVAFDREPQLAAAFRDGERQTDQDIRSLYDDLVSMGKIRSRRK
jgi:hypothetical protein